MQQPLHTFLPCSLQNIYKHMKIFHIAPTHNPTS